jgi:hypothetical protein
MAPPRVTNNQNSLEIQGVPFLTLILLANNLPPITASAVQHPWAITVPTVTYQKSTNQLQT